MLQSGWGQRWLLLCASQTCTSSPSYLQKHFCSCSPAYLPIHHGKYALHASNLAKHAPGLCKRTSTGKMVDYTVGQGSIKGGLAVEKTNMSIVERAASMFISRSRGAQVVPSSKRTLQRSYNAAIWLVWPYCVWGVLVSGCAVG